MVWGVWGQYHPQWRHTERFSGLLASGWINGYDIVLRHQALVCMLHVGPVTPQLSEETSDVSAPIGKKISFAFIEVVIVFYILASLTWVCHKRGMIEWYQLLWEPLIFCLVVACSYHFLLFCHHVPLVIHNTCALEVETINLEMIQGTYMYIQ